MISNVNKNELKQLARKICLENDLHHVYFTQKFGTRKHYLSGYGETSFNKVHKLDVNETVTMFWEGSMKMEKALKYIEKLQV